MSNFFPIYVPTDDKNIPLSQRRWLTPEQKALAAKKVTLQSVNAKIEHQARLEKELEFFAKYKKPFIKKALKH